MRRAFSEKKEHALAFPLDIPDSLVEKSLKLIMLTIVQLFLSTIQENVERFVQELYPLSKYTRYLNGDCVLENLP